MRSLHERTNVFVSLDRLICSSCGESKVQVGVGEC
jgi:hypothetical protein